MKKVDDTNNNKSQLEDIIIREIESDVHKLSIFLDSTLFQKYVKRQSIKAFLKNESFFDCCKLAIKLSLNKLGFYKRLPLNRYRFDGELLALLSHINNCLSLLKYDSPKHIRESNKCVKQDTTPFSCSALQNGYIAILVNSLDVGGLEQVVAHLARELTIRNINVQIWCLYKGGKIAETLIKDGITVTSFNGKSQKLINYLVENPPLLINTHYARLDFSLLSKYDIPIVEVVHNMYVVQDDKFLSEEKKKYYHCSKIIAVSDIVKSVYLQKIGEADNDHKVEIIGNAASLKNINPIDRSALREKLGIADDAFVFLNVGSIDARKNQISLIDAFEIVSQISSRPTNLILIGNTLDSKYEAKIKRRITHCYHKENILLLPYSEDIAAFYQIADAFVMNSYYEGWSIAATEALYCGLPIIHSECGSATELIRGGKYGIMISNPLPQILEMSSEKILYDMEIGIYYNLYELVHSMLELLSQSIEWKRQRAKMSQDAHLEFSQNNMIEKYIKIFSHLCLLQNKKK